MNSLAGLIALAAALVLDLLFADPPNQLHPVVAMGTVIRALSRGLNRGGTARRLVSGAVLVLFGAALFSLPLLLPMRLITSLPVWAQGIILGLLLKPVFSLRSLLQAGSEVKQALQQGNLEEGRRLAAWHLVSRDTSDLSTSEVAGAAVESLAENLTDSFFAPLVYFALGGLPLAWLYRFVNTADAMIGYRSDKYEYFGRFAARLDDVLNWLPARLGALAIVIASLLPGLGARSSAHVMLNQHKRTSSPNAGWTMAAAAGALGIVLEKRGCYRLEGGPSLPSPVDIHRAAVLISTAAVLCALFCSVLLFFPA